MPVLKLEMDVVLYRRHFFFYFVIKTFGMGNDLHFFWICGKWHLQKSGFWLFFLSWSCFFQVVNTYRKQYFSQYNWVLKICLSSAGWIRRLKFSIGLSFIFPLKNKGNKKNPKPSDTQSSVCLNYVLKRRVCLF